MRLIISFILFFILTKAFAQQNKVLTEQEYLILQSKIRLNFNASTDSAFIYAYQMAKSQNYKHLVFANGALSYLFQIQGKEKESKEKYALTLSYLKKIPDSKDKIQLSSYIYNFAGLTERKRNNYSAALENFQKAIKLSIQIDDIIQIVKIKANIALIHEAVGNYQLAIKNLKQLNKFVAENRNQYTEDDFSNRMSNINLGIGTSYEGYYMKNQSKMYLLDSAQYYYKKCIGYSDKFAENKVNSKLSLGNIYNWKHDFKNAEKTYHEVVVLAQQNDFKDLLCIAIYNLADVNYTLKNYNKALIYYQKCDSIASLTASNNLDYLKSNYYQAKIYTILNMPELAYKHSQIYLDKYDKFETKLNNETLEVNYKQGIDDLTTEMVSIEKKAKEELFWNKCLSVFYAFLVFSFIFLLVKTILDKKKAKQKMNALIREFKANIEKKESLHPKPIPIKPELIRARKERANLNIDQAKENKIIEKLYELEEKQEYLSVDFTLSHVAKTIKTNTTYLSHVVNKRFDKSFGEYANELKINYVINEMITNDSYRKYSTQATAESVGFKNAGSFAKSFRKRTGVSPAQFANNI